MFDVGDAIELTMDTTAGATVTVTLTPPGGEPTIPVSVSETPPASGLYPHQFTLTTAGMWRVTFTAAGTVAASETFHVFAQEPGPLPLATAAQVAALFRPLTDAEEPVVTAWLAKASRLLRGRFPDLDTRIASGDLDAGLAADAAVNMVLRVVRIPGALSGLGNIKAETTGPFRRDYYGADGTGGGVDVAVTDAEVALLAPKPAGGRRKGAGTIRVQAGLAPAATYGDSSVRLW